MEYLALIIAVVAAVGIGLVYLVLRDYDCCAGDDCNQGRKCNCDDTY